MVGVVVGVVDGDGLADTLVAEGEAVALDEEVTDVLGVADGVALMDTREGVTEADGLALTMVPDGEALTDKEGVTDTDGLLLAMVADGMVDGEVVAVTDTVALGVI
jgi:hypothetical protein